MFEILRTCQGRKTIQDVTGTNGNRICLAPKSLLILAQHPEETNKQTNKNTVFEDLGDQGI